MFSMPILLISAISDFPFLKKCCLKSQKTVKFTIAENHGIWPFRKCKTCYSSLRKLRSIIA